MGKHEGQAVFNISVHLILKRRDSTKLASPAVSLSDTVRKQAAAYGRQCKALTQSVTPCVHPHGRRS